MANESYHIHISSRHNWFDLKLREVWQYRELIFMFVKRSYTVSYKQTILGPLWLFISPVLSSIMYTIVFGHIAGLSTDGVPQLLFYLCSNAIWGYFSSCISGNASTFTGNAGLFGKVYFPRLTVPIANILSAVVRMGIQMILVLIILIYYVFRGIVMPNWWMWLLIPGVLFQLGLLGMGMGIIASSLTAKYRDLSAVIQLGISLWMYATPVVYPVSQLHDGILKQLLLLNPVTMPIEIFRYALLGKGTVSWLYLGISWLITLMSAVIGIILFNRVERTFMDTV